ncbi:signal peptide [Acinetobacter baumannii]|nr:signal peptide [Acinetobacter baumannii]
MKPIKESSETLKSFSPSDQAKILEMAYDDLYLQFIGRKVEESFAQPQLRQLLALRSQIDLDKQRQEPKRPSTEPTQGHNARNVSLKLGEVQGDKFIEIGHRQAYHDLIDPQGGYRAGTQLLFLNGNAQWRDDYLKLERLDLLEVNSYNPIQPFKTPLTWGFNLGWRQEAVHDGVYNDEKQHGVASFNAQVGYSLADYERKYICYGQVQTYVQAGSNLDKGWRVGVGPTLGCMNQWLEKFNTVVQVELPYWEDQNQWNLRLNTQWQYAINSNNAIRFNWDYEKQNHLDWMKSSLGYVWFF